MTAITLDGCHDEGGSRRVWARLTDAGALVVEGQDLGRGVEEAFGRSEYEWAVTIQPADQPALLAALGAAGGPVLDAVAARFSGPAAHRFKEYLDDHGITHEFWSRIGD